MPRISIRKRSSPDAKEVREGSVDVRQMVDLWGSDSEVKRYHELRSLSSNATLTNTEIAEMVLAEDWASKLKLQHELRVNDVTS